MPEIGFEHACIADHRLRQPLGDQPPVGEHEHVLGEAHHGLHHVLDHDDGDAPLEKRLHHRLQGYTWNLVGRIPADLAFEVTEVVAGETWPRARMRLHQAFAFAFGYIQALIQLVKSEA